MPALSRLATLFATMVCASSAVADVLPFDGSYGNAAGCLYAKTGIEAGSDNLFLLTPKGVTTSVSHCSFEQVINSTPQQFAVRADCRGEDTEATSPLDMNVFADGIDAYSLRLDDGTTWGPLALCQ